MQTKHSPLLQKNKLEAVAVVAMFNLPCGCGLVVCCYSNDHKHNWGIASISIVIKKIEHIKSSNPRLSYSYYFDHNISNGSKKSLVLITKAGAR